MEHAEVTDDWLALPMACSDGGAMTKPITAAEARTAIEDLRILVGTWARIILLCLVRFAVPRLNSFPEREERDFDRGDQAEVTRSSDNQQSRRSEPCDPDRRDDRECL